MRTSLPHPTFQHLPHSYTFDTCNIYQHIHLLFNLQSIRYLLATHPLVCDLPALDCCATSALLTADRKEPQGYDRAPRSSDRGVERSASRSNTTEMTFLIPAEKITRLLSEFSKIEAYTHTQIIYEAHTQRRGAPQEVRIVGTPADVLQCNQELVDRLKR
eukprot:m.57713 g.57713  ORF g.57713 m.57713 type:complete len:160 (+) comp6849_c0_seq1:2238-2717(+)